MAGRQTQLLEDRQRVAEGERNAFEQARAVMTEGARYNIGNINRNINAPTLALAFLTEQHRRRFEFKLGKRDDADPGVEIEYRETARPTFVSTTGGRDLPVKGRFWINETDGTVLRSELDAVDTGVEAHITVTYERDEGIGLFAPARMEERYRRPRDPMEVQGVATYSRFRRFQVSTTEELAPSAPDSQSPNSQVPNSQSPTEEPREP